MQKKLLLILLFVPLLVANEAEEIIKKVDNNSRGKSVYIKMKMTIKSKHHTRNIVMENWAKGKKKSFIRIISPVRDKGITFLSLNGKMWQYVPKIERTIKIPTSMMLQNWMGSDISNDDLVKQSSIVDDYEAKIVARKGKIITILLTPKDEASVVWGKIITQIDTRFYTKIKDEFYDEDQTKVRVFTYRDVKKFGKYYTPTIWTLKPILKPYNSTVLVMKKVIYDAQINEHYFKKSALKRYSR